MSMVSERETYRVSVPPAPIRLRTIVFGAIAAMMLYVIYHNERFLIDWAHPIWAHFEPFKWWLLVHGVAGACAVFLAPLQFFDGLRLRYTKAHRIVGRIYVVSVFVLSPLGVYIQYIQEADGTPRSFTVATIVSAFLFMATTALGLYFAIRRNIPAHRQWMTRSYAVALTFFEIRLILGVTGWDQTGDLALAETVVWVCAALAIFSGDIANQIYEARTLRRLERGAAEKRRAAAPTRLAAVNLKAA